jgi:hypothetical protein
MAPDQRIDGLRKTGIQWQALNVCSRVFNIAGIPDLPPEIATAVQSLQPNTIAGPIRSEGGFHILKLLDERVDAESGRREPVDDFPENRRVHRGIADDSPSTDARAAGFVLRLDEEDELGGGRGDRDEVRGNRAERDERQVRDAHVRFGRQRTGGEVAHVGALHDRHAFVAAQ